MVAIQSLCRPVALFQLLLQLGFKGKAMLVGHLPIVHIVPFKGFHHCLLNLREAPMKLALRVYKVLFEWARLFFGQVLIQSLFCVVAISARLAKSICCERLPQADVDFSGGLFFVHKEVDPCSLKPSNQFLVLIFNSLGPRLSFSLLINRTNDRVSNARLVPIS